MQRLRLSRVVAALGISPAASAAVSALRFCSSQGKPPTGEAAACGSPEVDAPQSASATPETPAADAVAAPPSGPAKTDGPDGLAEQAPEPVRWVMDAYQDPDTLPIIDENGDFIVSSVKWPTGEIAYTTPAPVDDKLAPRFGYNVVQVKKHVSWWKYNQKYPRLSLAYINIQVLFLLGVAWLAAFLTTENRRTTDEMKRPGAMVGEHRGKGPVTSKTQKVTFTSDEMSAMVDKAQTNWLDGSAEASYIGSKDYRMKQIPRPKEFNADDFRKR